MIGEKALEHLKKGGWVRRRIWQSNDFIRYSHRLGKLIYIRTKPVDVIITADNFMHNDWEVVDDKS
jgi:hypothetical protein